MNHLSVDQIIEFVSIQKLDDRSVDLAVSVNSHICRCGNCLKKVRAFQDIYNEFEKIQHGDFAAYLQEPEQQEQLQLDAPDFGD